MSDDTIAIKGPFGYRTIPAHRWSLEWSSWGIMWLVIDGRRWTGRWRAKCDDGTMVYMDRDLRV